MKEVRLFYAPEIAHSSQLPQDEAVHIVRVLRLQVGDNLLLTDGKGACYEAVIEEATQKRCVVNVVRNYVLPCTWKSRIELALAPTKNMDRIEWFAEKATEIGIDCIAFLNCDNSERRVLKTERIEKIVVAAMKQSHKAQLPEISPLTNFDTFISQPFHGQRFIAHCYDDESLSGNAVSASQPVGSEYVRRTLPLLSSLVSPDLPTQVLIGPEGDFSVAEVQRAIAAGFQPISLGLSRMRTETAALVAVHLMNVAKSY